MWNVKHVVGGCSGAQFIVDKKADQHEYENSGHKVKEKRDLHD